MSPNTRQTKKRLANDVVDSIHKYTGKLSKNDELEVLSMALTKLGLKDKILQSGQQLQKKSGRKMTPFPIRKFGSSGTKTILLPQ